MKKRYTLLFILVLLFAPGANGWGWEYGQEQDQGQEQYEQGDQQPYRPHNWGWPYDQTDPEYRIPSDKETWGHMRPGETERFNPYTREWEGGKAW